MDTMDPTTQKNLWSQDSTESQATEMATSLIQKNVDNFYHHAWVQSKESKKKILSHYSMVRNIFW